MTPETQSRLDAIESSCIGKKQCAYESDVLWLIEQLKEAQKNSHLRMSGETARNIILNVRHVVPQRKYSKSPLWSLVKAVTGHGSGYSIEICKSANLDPFQDAGSRHLKDYKKENQ